MPARTAHEAARGVRLEPALVLAPVPDPVLGPEHPAPPFAVQHGKIAHRNAKGARLQRAGSPLFDEIAITGLGFCERIDRHVGIIANAA